MGGAGWLRYGSGDWRTGWIPSLLGDLVARTGDWVVTVRGHFGPAADPPVAGVRLPVAPVDAGAAVRFCKLHAAAA
ncbi:MAG TPA: hypothetical protein VGV87_15400 [Blastocatellia bacterium]|nr:hypothetical protein [Blastocatellia bacterium]